MMTGAASPEPSAVAGVDAELRARLAERFGTRARFSEPLSRHTSFRIGGPADAWVDVDAAAELASVFTLARATGQPVLVLGSGTNVLVSDRGVHVCPILLEAPDSVLGRTLAEATAPFALRHHACYTCYQFGSICANPSASPGETGGRP